MTLCLCFSPKVAFLPTRAYIHSEALESGFVSFSDGQADKQRLPVLGRQYKKVTLLPSSRSWQEIGEAGRNEFGWRWSEEGPGVERRDHKRIYDLRASVPILNFWDKAVDGI